jgi:hypothetical protein
MNTREISRPIALAAAVIAAAVAHVLAQAPYEGPRTVPVGEVLPSAFVKGPHYVVGDTVTTPGYFDEFTLTTDYGNFDVEGQTMLAVRLREVEALARLADVSKSEVFLQGAGTAMVSVGKGAVSAATDPVGTAKGVGEGVKRFGVNLGRRAKRVEENVVEGAKNSEEAGPSTSEKAAAAGQSAAYAVLGVNASMRRWAEKVGADPYTTNPALRKALEDFGQVDAAGSIATKVIVPIPMVVSSASTVGNLVWKADPEELLKLNEKRLAELGVSKDAASAFFRTRPMTLTFQTAFIDALYATKAKGAADYVTSATGCETEREALFFTEAVIMLKGLHEKSPVAALLEDSRTLVAKTSDGRAVVLLPVDWARWTAPFEKAAEEIASRARSELGATSLELRMTGRITRTAKDQLAARGWKVTENVPASVYGSLQSK